MKSGSIEHGQAERLRSLDRQLQQKMSELKLATTDGKTLTKQRGRDTVAKCFHKIGIVVPYDMKTEVGYRPLPKTNSKTMVYVTNLRNWEFVCVCVCHNLLVCWLKHVPCNGC